MWLEFVIAAIAVAVLLFFPGYFLTRSVGAPRAQSLCFAPIISISLFCIVGQVFAFVGISIPAIALMGIVCAVPLLVFLGIRKKISDMPMPHITWWLPLLFVGIGCILGGYLFISALPSSDALFQAYDITKHLNLIQAIADSGRYSSLGTNVYLSAADQAIDPCPASGFYPAAWHIVCALIVALTGVTTPIAINASMFVFCFLAFPLSVLAFLVTLFPGKKKVVVCGSFVCLAFVSFPWNLLMFGPVFPNVAGFATLPAFIALCLLLFRGIENRLLESAEPKDSDVATPRKSSGSLKLLVLFLLAAIGQALLHPNTIFSCFIILVPFCVTRTWSICTARAMAKPKAGAVCLALIAVFAALWYACFKLPFMQDTVSHVWSPYASHFQAAIDVLTQTYTNNFFADMSAQIALGLLVVFGFVRAIHNQKLRWLAYSYVVICFIFIENAVREDYFKQILAGFWYTDPMRLASVAVIAAIPLAALGLSWVCDTCLLLVKTYNRAHKKTTHQAKTYAVVICLFLIVNYMPSFDLSNSQVALEKAKAKSENPGYTLTPNTCTTFGDFKKIAAETFTYTSPFSKQEQQFVREATDLIPAGSLVINNPMDGSFLAYGTTGMRTYYRDFSSYNGETETDESKILREKLNDLSANTQVQKAVDAIGARYVLVLDQADSNKSFINLRGNFHPDQFSGITSITDETPGFTCIYEKDGMKLFEINA